MTTLADAITAGGPPAAAPFLPYHIVPDWLGAEESDGLLAFALAHESAFQPALVVQGTARTVNNAVRSALVLKELGPWKPVLRDRVRRLVPELSTRFGLSACPAGRIEVEMAAHGDGAHFNRHIDTLTAGSRPITQGHRQLSLIYYFHRRPRGFSGGALRYYPLVPGAAGLDISPEHDRLLAFPSWAPHSVERVSCPSGQFADSRFAMNIWVYDGTAP